MHTQAGLYFPQPSRKINVINWVSTSTSILKAHVCVYHQITGKGMWRNAGAQPPRETQTPDGRSHFYLPRLVGKAAKRGEHTTSPNC